MNQEIRNLIQTCALWMRILAVLTIGLLGLLVYYQLKAEQKTILGLTALSVGGLAVFLFYVGNAQDWFGRSGREKDLKLGLEAEILFWKLATYVSVAIILLIYFMADTWLGNKG